MPHHKLLPPLLAEAADLRFVAAWLQSWQVFGASVRLRRCERVWLSKRALLPALWPQVDVRA